jgi:restriction system-associated AAA family ATPase
MKLLRLKLISGPNLGILQGFDYAFYPPTLDSTTSGPQCWVGDNGSGKSQLLQRIAEAFYCLDQYLEKGRRETGKDAFEFELEYLIQIGDKPAHVVLRNQKPELKPRVFVRRNKDERELQDPAEIKQHLPSRVVGYTSGENETLSVPFLDVRQEYAMAVADMAKVAPSDQTSVPDTRLVMTDYNSNIAIVVANHLLRKEEELEWFPKFTRVKSLHSFRIIIQLNPKDGPSGGVRLTEELKGYRDALKKCATCFDHNKGEDAYVLDFFITNETKKAFQRHFGSPSAGSSQSTAALNLYSTFTKFEMLNDLVIKKEHRQQVNKLRKEQKIVIKPPAAPEANKVFRFQSVRLTLEDSPEIVDYISLSDGEHQFAHIFSTLMMFDQPNILFLLDEPEAHFNPKWRSQFISMFSKVMKGRKHCTVLTSHAPFVLSDSRRDDVFIFRRKGDTIKIDKPNVETYGTAFDKLLAEAFDVEPPISVQSRDAIQRLQKSDNIDDLQKKVRKFGDSVEKFFVFQRIEELKAKKSRR